jgi:hypothetical protein
MAGANRNSAASVPAYRALVITPSDATIIPTSRSLYIGVSGNLTVRMVDDGATIQFANVPVGVFPIQVDQVFSTGTTATNIVALY